MQSDLFGNVPEIVIDIHETEVNNYIKSKLFFDKIGTLLDDLEQNSSD